jgi:hypothetical protein
MDIFRKKIFSRMKETLDKCELWVYSRHLSSDNSAHKGPSVIRVALTAGKWAGNLFEKKC